MESGSLVNSSLSRSEGSEAGLPGRSYQISPIGAPSWAAVLQGDKSTTPHGLGTACTRARSIAMRLLGLWGHQWCGAPIKGSRIPLAPAPSESTQMIGGDRA